MRVLDSIGGLIARFFANHAVYAIARMWSPSDWNAAHTARQSGKLSTLMRSKVFVASLVPYAALFTLATFAVLYTTAPLMSANMLLVGLVSVFGGAFTTAWGMINFLILGTTMYLPATHRAVMAKMASILDQRRANGLDAD